MGDDDDDSDERADEQPNVPPKIPFDAETMECVLDLRALCGLPQDSEEDGALAFRALLLPKGKTLHVPGEPGCYATLGPWQSQVALSLVHFVPATARKPELLLAFADYGMLSFAGRGRFVMSLQLPLQKARNVFEETPRLTKIADVAGFTPIDVKSQPWCSLLEPALKRHPIYEEQKIYSPAAIITYMRAPLARRIETLVKSARKGIAEKVKALARQDKRQAEKASARMEAQLDAAHEFLKALPPKKYDRRMEERVIVVKPDASDGPDWLTTPKRGELEAGSAVCLPTARAERAAPAPVVATPVAAAPAAAAPAAAAADTAARVAMSPELGSDEDDDDSDVDAAAVPLDVVGAKRTRKAAEQFDPAPTATKKKAGKAKATAVCAMPQHTHRLPAARTPTIAYHPKANRVCCPLCCRTNCAPRASTHARRSPSSGAARTRKAPTSRLLRRLRCSRRRSRRTRRPRRRRPTRRRSRRFAPRLRPSRSSSGRRQRRRQLRWRRPSWMRLRRCIPTCSSVTRKGCAMGPPSLAARPGRWRPIPPPGRSPGRSRCEQSQPDTFGCHVCQTPNQQEP